MTSPIRKLALHFLAVWVDIVQRFSALVILLALLIAGLSLNYTTNNLGMNTDTKDMLSPELEWRKLDLEYEKNFPQYTDNLLVVVEANTPDQAIDAAHLLYEELRQENQLFKSVFYPNALSIFSDSALLFLDLEELFDLSDNLAEIQPFLGKLTRDQTLHGLFLMLEKAISARVDGDDVDINRLVTQINKTLSSIEDGKLERVSWHQLMSSKSEKTTAPYREFIILQPVLDYSSLLPATEHMEKIRQLVTDLKLEESIGAKVRLSGSAALSHEDLLSVTRGTERAMMLAFMMVSVIMIVGLGSVRLVISTLTTLIFGLILTAAFATLTVGNLNLISVAFAVLYIGLGVDFAIHFCLRYRELRLEDYNNISAIREASLNVGSSLFLCALTTAIGFFAFMPTDYDGVAELGWISGSGMFVSLLVTLTLLPALLHRFPVNFNKRTTGNVRTRNMHWMHVFPFTHSGKIKIICSLVVIIFLFLITRIYFDYNTLNLQDPSNESVATYQDLLSDSDTSPWTGIILAGSEHESREIIGKLEKLSLVEKVVWIRDFIPDNQDEKLAVIEEMDLLLGDLTAEADNTPLTTIQNVELISGFTNLLNESDLIKTDPELRELGNRLDEFLTGLEFADPSIVAHKLEQMEKGLLSSLPGRLKTLSNSLNADTISLNVIPEQLLERWYNDERQRFLIEIYPKENLQDNQAMRRFVEQLKGADPRIVGSPVINIEASDAVIKAFKEAFTYAFLVITLFLLILLVHKRDTIYIICSLVTAAIFTGGLSVMFSIPLNFANVIALPLILGIGVDSGIHILHRFRTALPEDLGLLGTSSARAVMVSAMTTMGSIGNLAFSPQLGTASMGKLLTIGIAMTLICMLLVLPALLASQLPSKIVNE